MGPLPKAVFLFYLRHPEGVKFSYLQINDSIAKNYYVTGLQGGKKGIDLDRSLVQWECKL